MFSVLGEKQLLILFFSVQSAVGSTLAVQQWKMLDPPFSAFGRYQIILLGDRGTCLCVNELPRVAAGKRVSPWVASQRPHRYATELYVRHDSTSVRRNRLALHPVRQYCAISILVFVFFFLGIFVCLFFTVYFTTATVCSKNGE